MYERRAVNRFALPRRHAAALLPLAVASFTLWGCNAGTQTASSPGRADTVDTAAASPFPGAASTTPAPTPTPSLKKREPVTLDEPVRAIYVSGWTAGGTTRWRQLLDLLDKTEANAMVIDVKEDGMMSYATDIALANETGANFKMIPNIDAKLQEMQKRKVYAIARITCFRDRVVARKRRDLAVQNPDGSPWRDRSGHYWLDPYNKANWDYNVAVAVDAAKRGFAEIQWDYVRFPSEGARSGRRYAAKAKDDKRSDARVIADFLKYAREKLKPYNVVMSADIFGLTVSAKPDDDMGIGQKVDLMTQNLDYICPMIYPSHYGRGEYNISYPNAAPYRTVSYALRDAVKRVKGTKCRIRPWLQDFSLGVHYGEPEVRAQIKAAREHGVNEYLLWNASNRYTTAALIPPRAKAKPTEKPKSSLTASPTSTAENPPTGTPNPSPGDAASRSRE